jgi:hypothetical protein
VVDTDIVQPLDVRLGRDCLLAEPNRYVRLDCSGGRRLRRPPLPVTLWPAPPLCLLDCDCDVELLEGIVLRARQSLDARVPGADRDALIRSLRAGDECNVSWLVMVELGVGCRDIGLDVCLDGEDALDDIIQR